LDVTTIIIIAHVFQKVNNYIFLVNIWYFSKNGTYVIIVKQNYNCINYRSLHITNYKITKEGKL